MKKKVLLSLFLALPLMLSAQSTNKWGKDVSDIEATYSATAKPGTLRENKAFVKKVKKVIAKADASSLYLINKYPAFIYMNGMKGDVEAALAKMPQSLKDSNEGIEAQSFYYSMRKLEVGAKVPDFTASTPEGKQVNFYSFIKGKKCVILDFWASWCAWCRKESPNVQKAYDTYKDAGFDAISVSFDDNKDRWTKAIAHDKTTWMQVSDLKGTNSPLYSWYDLSSIPAIFLIDGNGVILEMKMRGEAIFKNTKKHMEK
ncbi:MAG: TlpA family protein disulfide reductase [Prevotella sp.]